MRPFVIRAVVVLLFIVSPAASAAVMYTFTDLGKLIGGIYNAAYGINNHGQIVGGGYYNDAGRAWIYSNAKFTDLGTFGSQSAVASAINDSGQVAVTADSLINNRTQDTGWIYHNGQSTRLPTSAGTYTQAIDINASGQVAGTVTSTPSGTPNAAIFAGNNVTRLGSLSTRQGAASYAIAINDSGVATGISHIDFSIPGGAIAYHSFVYKNGQLTDIGTLGGYESHAHDINNKGQIVGQSTTIGAVQRRAFLYDNGTMINLGSLAKSGFDESDANAINESGQVVGKSDTGTTVTHAFIWENGKMTDLNTLVTLPAGWTLREATDINDDGDIVGWGYNPQGTQYAFLLEAIDLPDPPPGVPLPPALAAGTIMATWIMGRSRRSRRA